MATFKKFTEAPIDTFQTLGNFDKGSSFKSKTDRTILQNDKAVQKIKNKWAESKHKYDMYFLNSKEAAKHGDEGAVDADFIKNELKLDKFENDPDAITIIFTGNSGDERVQLTPWILAHRFGHTIWASRRSNNPEHKKINEAWDKLLGLIAENVNPIFDNGYEHPLRIATRGDMVGLPASGYYSDQERATAARNNDILRKFYGVVGTMKSARDDNVIRPYEFYYELLAQYIFSNEIKFNHIPKVIGYGKKAWGRNTNEVRFRGNDHDFDYYDSYMQNIVDEYPGYADYLLNRCVGKVFVM